MPEPPKPAPPMPAPPVAPQPGRVDPASDFVQPAATGPAHIEAFEAIDDLDTSDEDFESTIVITRAKTTTQWSLVDIDGTKFALAAQNVLGRKPNSGPEGAQIIALSDPERVLSRTHLLIEVEDDQLWITDLESTNGTEIVTDTDEGADPGADTGLLSCEALNRYAVTVDQSLSLGGRSITFEGPAA